MKKKQGLFLGDEQESTIENVISCLVKLTPKLGVDNYSFVVQCYHTTTIYFMLAPNPSVHFP